jgi:uncharacterized delta-60 repeat protein
MRARWASALGCAAAGLVLVAAAPAAASPGALDPSFGSGGIVATPFGVTSRAAGVARGPDGRLVLTGDLAGAGVLTARFSPSGALDMSFSGDGSRIDHFGDGGEPPQRGGAVAVQADGGVVVAGVAGGSWMLARYRPDGSPDVLFGAGGVTLRDPSGGGGFPSGTGPQAIAIAPNGQIVVAGSSGVATDDGIRSEQIVVARYSDRGVPDPGFGQNGFATLQLGRSSSDRHGESKASGLALLADGRIVIAGRSSDAHGSDRAFIARLMTSGALDGTFASGGRRLLQLGMRSPTRLGTSAFTALAVRADGSLLAAGRASDVAGGDAVALARFTSSGALDPGFGATGSVVTQIGAASRTVRPGSVARTLGLAPDGGALTTGAATGGTLATRFDPGSGRLSCGYGTRGRTLLPATSAFNLSKDGAASAVVQPDGALALAGRQAGGGVLLARLLGGPVAALGKRPPHFVSLFMRARRGRGYLYGYIDPACSATRVRFEAMRPSGKEARTHAQLLRAGTGPQVVCARLGKVRVGGRYRIHMVSQGPAGAFQEVHRLRAVARKAKLAPQGCVH